MLVHTLACEAHLWFAIPCLKSLLDCSEEPVRLVIHDDGSLTEESLARFAAAFPDAVLVGRQVADEQLAEALKRFPNIADARGHLPHVLKLFDTTMTHPEAIVCYVDTDILFQKRFRGLFPETAEAGSSKQKSGLAKPGGSAKAPAGAFMMDHANCFGAHPGDFRPFGPLRVARQLNSGLFWVRRDRIDYERMEYLFKRWGPERIKKYHGWFEQTIWADHAWRTRCALLDPKQFGTASAEREHNERLVGVHYVTPTRSLLKSRLEAGALAPGNAASVVEEVRVVPAKPFGVLGAAYVAASSVVSRDAAG
jgi:hypothetical protein